MHFLELKWKTVARLRGKKVCSVLRNQFVTKVWPNGVGT